MFEFITLFFPGIYSTSFILSGLISKKSIDKKRNLLELLEYIQIFIFIIIFNNTIALLLFSKIYKINLTVVDGQLNQAFLSLRFLTFAFIIAIISGIIGKKLILNFKFFISHENNMKNSVKIIQLHEEKEY